MCLRYLPESRIARHVQPHGFSDGDEEVVPLGVEEVPAGDLGALVPAREGRAGELEAAALEHHAAHPRQPEPGEAEAGDGLVGGVLYPHLQHTALSHLVTGHWSHPHLHAEVVRQLVVAGLPVHTRQQHRQEVEWSALTFPSKLLAKLK